MMAGRCTLTAGPPAEAAVLVANGGFRMTKLQTLCGLALLGFGLAAPASAHHGAALYEPQKTVTIAGTVTEFQFSNPHVLVYIDAQDADGKEVKWGGELTSPNRLARMGGPVKWHKDLLKPGDKITMTGRPARNGAPAMVITQIVDAHGVALLGDGN
jgi:Family of unknown function (DUF6152)